MGRAIRINGRSTTVDDRIELDADQDTLEFDYTAPRFVRPAQVRFRYRLAGLHDDWVEAGARRTAAYHQVPPGQYRLEVVATSGNGEWSAEPAALAIIIHAPFWRQAWVQVLAGAGVVSLAILLALRRAERLKGERDRQRAYSNDLHDSLGQTLFMIRQHARALSDPRSPDTVRAATADTVAGLAARAHHEMKEIAHALRPYQLDKIGLTGTIEGMVHRVRDACGIQMVADLEDVDDLIAAHEQIGGYRIIHEAVNNVVRHADATEAVVRMRRRGRAVDIEVWDNGRGLEPVEATGDPESTAGLGLTSMRARDERLPPGAVHARRRNHLDRAHRAVVHRGLTGIPQASRDA